MRPFVALPGDLYMPVDRFFERVRARTLKGVFSVQSDGSVRLTDHSIVFADGSRRLPSGEVLFPFDAGGSVELTDAARMLAAGTDFAAGKISREKFWEIVDAEVRRDPRLAPLASDAEKYVSRV